MIKQQQIVLASVAVLVAVAILGGWIAGSTIESPAEAAARTAAPTPSPILVPVEKRVLSSDVVTRGTGRFGLPQPISISPSPLKPAPGRIATLPLRNAPLEEGALLLTASGRPVFLMAGNTPAYRDLVPGISGEDVRQFEAALERLGFDPGPIDAMYDARTSAAVERWYKASGWEPFGPTREQKLQVQAQERDWGEARKQALAAQGAFASAALYVESARATATHNNRMAEAELAARIVDRRRLIVTPEYGTPLAIESEQARAEHANAAASAEVDARIADAAIVAVDPRQTETARRAADAQLDVARASLRNTKLIGELAVQAAERDAKLAAEQFELAEAGVNAAKFAGEMAIQAALETQKVAQLDLQLSQRRVEQLDAEIVAARRQLGIQVPVDEIVFVPLLPVRVEDVTAAVGDMAVGTLMSLTDNQLAIDSSLPLDTAPLVREGMRVGVDEQALGIKATGVVSYVATTPGTRGVDGYHFYFEVRVDESATPLAGFSLRLKIPIESTAGEVTAVPVSAVSLAVDGTSRVRVQRDGALEYVPIEPGLSAGGYVEVKAVEGTLAGGELVVVGYENPADAPI